MAASVLGAAPPSSWVGGGPGCRVYTATANAAKRLGYYGGRKGASTRLHERCHGIKSYHAFRSIIRDLKSHHTLVSPPTRHQKACSLTS
jgi:hypothetical protein